MTSEMIMIGGKIVCSDNLKMVDNPQGEAAVLRFIESVENGTEIIPVHKNVDKGGGT